MAPPSLAGLFQIGIDILNTLRDGKTQSVIARTGDAYNEVSEADGVEWWQHVGFASRPPKASKNSACQGVVIRDSGHDACVASRDLRGQELAGLLEYGETCVYGAGTDAIGQCRSIWKRDGSITHYTTVGNKKGTTGIYSRVGPGADADTGLPDGFTWAAPWGTMKFDETGFHVLHKSGAQFHIGAIGGLPSPLDALTSYCSIQAGSFSTSSSGQSLGAGVTQPLALQPAVTAALAGLQAQITVLQAALAAHSITFNAFVDNQDDVTAKSNVKATSTAISVAATGGAAAGIAAVVAANLVMPANTQSAG